MNNCLSKKTSSKWMITYLKNYLFDLKEFITNLDLKCQIPTLDLLLSHLEVGISPRQGRILRVFPFLTLLIIDVLSFLFLWCSLLVLLGHKNFQMIFKKAKRNNRLLCTSSVQHHSPCRSPHLQRISWISQLNLSLNLQSNFVSSQHLGQSSHQLLPEAIYLAGAAGVP